MSNEVDELKERIEELEQTIDDHNNELISYEEIGYDKAMLEVEGKIEHSFNAGFFAGMGRDTMRMRLKLFLDYKMEQRL